MNYRLEIYKGKKGWYLRIVSRNGKIVMDGGEAYKNKWNAMRAGNRFVEAFYKGAVSTVIL